MKIFIPGNVPSSKNSKRWTGKMLINSKTVMKYIKESKEHYHRYKCDFIKQTENKTFPVKVSFKFIRKSKHKFDYINPAQTVQDLMVQHGWIDDDNCQEMKPVFLDYKYDRENPGVIISI